MHNISRISICKLRAFGFLCVLTICASISHQLEAASDLPPVSDVRRELAMELPGLMADTRTPGAAVALIRDGRLQFVENFGVSNIWTGQPVRDDTIFDAASNGKLVTALLAMQMVEEGRLDPDRPLSSYLPPHSRGSNGLSQVTLRQVLSHTSGLANRVWQDIGEPEFSPGTRFSYSGNGFVYLSRVLEAISGRPFEQLAQERVFRPLHMASASFVSGPNIDDEASPHIALEAPLAPYLQVFLIYCLPAVLLISLLLNFLIYGRRRPAWWMAAGAVVVALAISQQPFVHMFGASALRLWVPMGILLTAILVIGLLIVHLISLRFGWLKSHWPIQAAAGLAIGYSLIWLIQYNFNDELIPTPVRRDRVPIAGTTLRASSADLGRLAAELARPRLIGADTAALMRTPQVWINERVGWALGIAVRRNPRRTTFWHSGHNPGSQSLVVVDPATGDGVVVMTNGDNGIEVARKIAGRVFAVEPDWSIR